MKRYILIIAVMFYSLGLSGREQAEISLLTCSAGQELYSKFGHSAIRVYYPRSGEDIVFNFGLFDFNTPNFYIKFIRGKLEYMLGIQYTKDFVAQYEWEGRSVFEQKLSLTDQQKENILARLDYLNKPENRYYHYSFLYRNCTTELRDLILKYVSIPDKFLSYKTGETNRKLLNECTEGWAKFGINLILGSSLDREIDIHQRMFLPENLMEEFSKMDNSGISLVGEEEIIVNITGRTETRDRLSVGKIFSPVAISVALLILAIFSSIQKKAYKAISRIFFAVFGFAGLFLVVVTLITEHVEIYWNLNILWCNPLFLIPAFVSVSKTPRFYEISLILLLISLAGMACIWITGFQYAEYGFIIMAAALALLSWNAKRLCRIYRSEN